MGKSWFTCLTPPRKHPSTTLIHCLRLTMRSPPPTWQGPGWILPGLGTLTEEFTRNGSHPCTNKGQFGPISHTLPEHHWEWSVHGCQRWSGRQVWVLGKHACVKKGAYTNSKIFIFCVSYIYTGSQKPQMKGCVGIKSSSFEWASPYLAPSFWVLVQ